MNDGRKSILMRAYFIYIMMLLFGVAIFGKIAYIQWWEGEHWRKISNQISFRHENIEARRGNIFSDNENLLATSEVIYDIGMDVNPSIVPDTIFYAKLDSLTRFMGEIFGKPNKFYRDKLLSMRSKLSSNANISRYVALQRDVSFAELEKIRQWPLLKKGNFDAALVADGREKRVLSYRNLAERTIGYVQLAQYDITLNFGKEEIPRERFDSTLNNLALSMYNLFHDGLSVDKYKSLLLDSYENRANIIKRINSRQLRQLKEFPLIGTFEEGKGLKTVQLNKEYMVGLEGAYNDLLSGCDGTRILKKTGSGTWRIISDQDLVEPENGADIYTSIDIDLQDVADNALRKCLDSNRAQWGCAVLMEVETGFIKAIVNLTRDSNGRYHEKLNYAIGHQIEPGSTFKLASMIACLEDGLIDTSTLVPTGTGEVGYRVVKDAHTKDYGIVSLQRAFEISSNLGISSVTYKLFISRIPKFKELIAGMGLNEPLGIEIAGEPNPKMDIAPGDLETIPYGYVVKMTPLQILALYNAVANNGTLVRPRFVKAIRKAGSLNEYTSPVVLKEAICSEQTLKKVRAMLEGVVQRGTATNIRKCDYEIAGKTGTVRIFEEGKYIDKYVASFVGYFPAEKPRYSCIVVVSRPMGNEYYGSRIAAPVFKEIADKVYAARLDIHASRQEEIRKHAPPLSHTGKQQDLTTVYKVLNFRVVSSNPSGEYAASGRNAETIHLMPRRYAQDVIPDVRGMGARNAVYLLEKLGLKVSLSGKGTVTKQSLQAGQKITPGNEIRLELSML